MDSQLVNNKYNNNNEEIQAIPPIIVPIKNNDLKFHFSGVLEGTTLSYPIAIKVPSYYVLLQINNINIIISL